MPNELITPQQMRDYIDKLAKEHANGDPELESWLRLYGAALMNAPRIHSLENT